MKRPSWKFWLFGIFVIVSLEVLRVALFLSQGYVWLGLSGLIEFYEELGPAYLMGNLLGYALMVLIVAYGSAWIWQKIRKR